MAGHTLPVSCFVVLLLSLLLLVTTINGQRFKRCFACRSRGPRGGCRDPFDKNATMSGLDKSIQLDPCASGWCGKVIEGKEDDHLQATERFCLQRPPDDNSETCAESALQNRKNIKLYVCLCRGDLCNAGQSHHQSHYISHVTHLAGSFLTSFLFYLFLM